eukprot:Sro1659_g289210.1 n/a (407) ;mRNA; r:9034-10446
MARPFRVQTAAAATAATIGWLWFSSRRASVVNGMIAHTGTTTVQRDDVALPTPYTQAAHPSSVLFDSIDIHGVPLQFAVRKFKHIRMLHDHLQREIHGYAILKDAIRMAQQQQQQRPPLVLDVGANHGLYSLFAAKLGADVIAVEPQQNLCKLINRAAQENNVADRITVYHNAALDEHDETISMKHAKKMDGQLGTVVREGERTNTTLRVEQLHAFRIQDFVAASSDGSNGKPQHDIAFLKIDVEGFELQAAKGAAQLFTAKRIQNTLVEFGPPSRWQIDAGVGPELGLHLLQDMYEQYDTQPRLIESFVWPDFLASISDDDARSRAEQQKMVPLTSHQDWKALIQAMDHSGKEAYLWFALDDNKKHSPNEFQTFQSNCGTDHNVKRIMIGEGRKVTRFGCAAARG